MEIGKIVGIPSTRWGTLRFKLVGEAGHHCFLESLRSGNIIKRLRGDWINLSNATDGGFKIEKDGIKYYIPAEK